MMVVGFIQLLDLDSNQKCKKISKLWLVFNGCFMSDANSVVFVFFCRKDDFDLCSICFAAMGSEADYIRIDRPVHYQYRHPRPFRGLYDHVCILLNCSVP